MIIPLSILRFFQLAFAAIVLGLSIAAIKWQRFGSAPAASGYAAFAGAWGILTSLVGIAAIFVASLAGIIMAAADVLAFVILLAAGIAYAVKLSGVDCGAYQAENYSNPIVYDLLNGGMDGKKVGIVYDVADGASLSDLKGRCNLARADTAFMFLACVASIAAGVLVLLAHRRGGTRHSAV